MLSPYKPSLKTVKDKIDKKLIAELEAKGTLKYVTFGTALNFLLDFPRGSISIKSVSWTDKEHEVTKRNAVSDFGTMDVLIMWTSSNVLDQDVWHPTPADMFRSDYIITKK